MYCPSCGKETPDGSRFCLHCGTQIQAQGSSSVKQPVSWMQRDFVVHSWPSKQVWYNVSGTKYTKARVRLEIWMNHQAQIAPKLQELYDKGWQPIGEVGPSNIELNEFKKVNWPLAIAATIFSAGGALLIFPVFVDKCVEPTEFRVKMRRPKR